MSNRLDVIEQDFDGGPAFPIVFPEGEAWKGMSLREYMAVHAPTEEIKATVAAERFKSANKTGFEYLAAARYQWADAMIKAGKA